MGGSESRRPVGFPAERTSFVGRRHELAEAKRLLAESRLLTLTGVGGVGKTRLAGRIAEQLRRAFPDGVRMVALAGLQDEAFVPHAVVDALGIRNEAGRRPLDLLLEHLRDRRMLLVLDNCEHLDAACASLTGAVLSATTGVRVLATSRHRLGLPGEHLLDVRPLHVPVPEDLTSGSSAAARFPALALFADRAAAVVPGFEVDDTNQEAVARLCRHLDGLPLAIELAAVRLRALGIDQLVEHLEDRYRLLTGGSSDAPPRHRTLRGAVDWSHDLCTPQERAVWARLSVIAGDIDLDAAEAVCAEEDVRRGDVLDALADLVDKSVLIRLESARGRVRYRLLDSLREYGRERLRELDLEVVVRRRHRDHFVWLAEEFERMWFGPAQAEIADLVHDDLDDYRAALDFCLTTPGEAQQGLRMAGSLWFYWFAGGAWGEGRHWLDQALRAGARPDEARARAQWAAGLMALIHSRSTALLLDDAPGDPGRPEQGDLPPAPMPPASTPELLSTAPELLSFAVLNRVELACTLVFQGRAAAAVPLGEEAVSLCKARAEQWTRAYALRTLALAHYALGEYAVAERHIHACLRLPYAVHEPLNRARSLDLLAAITAAAREPERAAVLQGAADRLWRDIGRDPLEARKTGRIRTGERRARRALGDGHFERAFQTGGTLTPEEALAYALGRAAAPDPARPRTEPRRTQPPQPEIPGAQSLTRREIQVAELVALGLTNRQIAERLVIAQRTAEGHVERILGKLGFTNRSQVAAWFSSGPGHRPPGGPPPSP
ncbi:ATP-binding protein [Streptomyces fulvoviolaceus]|uniref:ATP-binding protein n=1 Tax=Streptomyces fulvoviolaceus TaxID=285535 RepID=UPI0021BEB5F3|nr:LuxR C-terminal-related transcriptional regulator [Streptomyces fulvoviolaceus]MCT9081329.1 LuxR C-terminal-related transcriptional regulator [Streptomyces fulvoviolaceus]